MEVVMHFCAGESLTGVEKLCGHSPVSEETMEQLEQLVKERELVTCPRCLEILSRRPPSMGRSEYGTHLRRSNRHE